MKRLVLIGTLLVFSSKFLVAQSFTHADTLRGSIGLGRDWWDVLKYDLYANLDLADSTISGYNTIQFKALKVGNVMQIDLQDPMIIDSIYIYYKKVSCLDQKIEYLNII